jgi:2-C-methyl-D-erythritol 4-phosphate cytidylyltransferase
MGKTIAIITAAGSGRRLKNKTKKQFILLKERPLLFWTLDKFVDHQDLDELIVVLPQEQMNFRDLIKTEFSQINISCIAGGKERQESVYKALCACPPDTDLVLIHDGVRPFIAESEIRELVKLARDYSAVIAASKIKNTIKQVAGGKIVRTIPRENLYNALTPQVFKFELIFKYHKKAWQEGLYFTDDSAILEHYGEKVQIFECSAENFKITLPQDILLAEKLL